MPIDKPFTLLAMVLVAISTYLDWYWTWGLLFIYWAIPSIQSGEAFLVERILRARNPVMFWAIVAMWVGFGITTLYTDLAWRLTI